MPKKDQDAKKFLAPPEKQEGDNSIRPQVVTFLDQDQRQIHDPSSGDRAAVQAVIDQLASQHYQLTSQSAAKLQHPASTKPLSLTFLRLTKLVKQTAQVHLVITYRYADGQTAAPAYSLSLSFERTGEADLTRPDQGVQDWSAWTLTQPSQSPHIVSPFIKQPKAGFSGRPSQAAVGLNSTDLASLQLQLVDGETTQWTKHVTYPAQAEQATIRYVDDDAEQKVLAIDRVWGRFGQVVKFPLDPYQRSEDFQDRHYKLTSLDFRRSSRFQAGGSNFTAHFKHQHQSLNRQTAAVVAKISYLYEDGTPTGVKPVAQRILYSRDGWQDLVTGNAHWQAWEQTGQLRAVPSPKLSQPKPGFSAQPSRQLISFDEDLQRLGQNPRPGQQTVLQKKVLYPAVKGQEAAAAVTFVDDEGEQGILEAMSVQGQVGQAIKFPVPVAKRVQAYQQAGYQLAPAKSHLPTGGAVFQPGQLANNFTVHLIHQRQPVKDKALAVELIYYLSSTGHNLRQPERKELQFVRSGVKDLVTGHKHWNSGWQASGQGAFPGLQAPAMAGLQPVAAELPGEPIRLDQLRTDQPLTFVKIFTYLKKDPGQGQAVLTLVDATRKQPLASFVVTGSLGAAISFQPAVSEQISDYQARGWTLQQSTWQAGSQFASTPRQFVLQLAHQEKPLPQQTCQVERRVSFELADGKSLGLAPVVQTLTYSRTGQQDEVTGHKQWQQWTSSDQFQPLTVPQAAGFSSQAKTVAAPAVPLAELVPGRKLVLRQEVVFERQTGQAEFKFVDQETRQAVIQFAVKGQLGQAIAWPAGKAAALTEQGYDIVGRTWQEGAAFNADKQIFAIQLKHAHQHLEETTTVIWKLTFARTDQKALNLPAQKQTRTYRRSGLQDLVTKESSWDDWQADQQFAPVKPPALDGLETDTDLAQPPLVDLNQLQADQPLTLNSQVLYQPKPKPKPKPELKPLQPAPAPDLHDQQPDLTSPAKDFGQTERAVRRKQLRHAARRNPSPVMRRGRRQTGLLAGLLVRSRFYR